MNSFEDTLTSLPAHMVWPARLGHNRVDLGMRLAREAHGVWTHLPSGVVNQGGDHKTAMGLVRYRLGQVANI